MHGSIMFACAIALVPCCSAPARADEQRRVTCENTEAVYAGIDNANYRMIFQGRTLGHGPPRLVGLLRMTKGEKTVEFRFTEEWSYNGLSRDYISLRDDADVISMIMRLNANFTKALTGPTRAAAPFVITPDLAVKFYHSKLPEHSNPEMIPPEVWKLVGCNEE